MTRTLLTLSATAALTLGLGFTAPAMAADSGSFTVVTTSDANIRAGAQAFEKGDYKKSIGFTRAALKTPLSKKRKASAQSNLCAAYAGLGDMSAAKEACDTALTLRPGYKAAVQNSQALSVKLAAK